MADRANAAASEFRAAPGPGGGCLWTGIARWLVPGLAVGLTTPALAQQLEDRSPSGELGASSRQPTASCVERGSGPGACARDRWIVAASLGWSAQLVTSDRAELVATESEARLISDEQSTTRVWPQASLFLDHDVGLLLGEVTPELSDALAGVRLLENASGTGAHTLGLLLGARYLNDFSLNESAYLGWLGPFFRVDEVRCNVFLQAGAQELTSTLEPSSSFAESYGAGGLCDVSVAKSHWLLLRADAWVIGDILNDPSVNELGFRDRLGARMQAQLRYVLRLTRHFGVGTTAGVILRDRDTLFVPSGAAVQPTPSGATGQTATPIGVENEERVRPYWLASAQLEW